MSLEPKVGPVVDEILDAVRSQSRNSPEYPLGFAKEFLREHGSDALPADVYFYLRKNRKHVNLKSEKEISDAMWEWASYLNDGKGGSNAFYKVAIALADAHLKLKGLSPAV